MTLTTNKLPDIIDIIEVFHPWELGIILDKLLFVPEAKLRNKIIYELAKYLQKKISDPNYPLKVFATFQESIPTGFVVCQIDPEYRSYGMRCGTFGWLHSDNLESCNLLMNACENYIRENKLKRLRGPINYPKFVGGVGFQILGHDAPMINGVAFNSANMREKMFLEKLGYKQESEYSCLHVTEKTWGKGNTLDSRIRLKLGTPYEIRTLKPKLIELARNSFYSVLADSPGGSSRVEEIFKHYDAMIPYLGETSKILEIDPKTYFRIPEFIEAFEGCDDPTKVVPSAPMAFDRETGELVGIILALPNYFQIWKNEKLTHMNVDTVMIKKEYAGMGIFSALNNIGQLMCEYRGTKYIEGTTIWSNNDRAIKTIFPHGTLRRKHIVCQKRLLKK